MRPIAPATTIPLAPVRRRVALASALVLGLLGVLLTGCSGGPGG